MAAAWAVPSALWDRLAASDPGLVRLILAVRGTTAVLLMTLLAALVGREIGVAPVEFAGGITLSLMGPFLMREPTRAARARTLLTLLGPAAASTVGTTLLHGHGPAGDSCFLLLVFLCFLFHPRHPRMIGVGLVAVVEAYVGLYLELPPSTLPVQLLSLLMAVPVVAFACFVVVPMNPAATLRRTVKAVQWRAAHVLHSAGAIDNAHDATGAAVTRLRRDLARLNEAALAADDQLTLLHPGGRDALRVGLINLELATGRVIEAIREGRPGPRHAARLLLHERRMRRGRRYVIPASRLAQGSLLAELVQLGHAVHALGVAAGGMVTAPETAPAPALPPGPLAWRMAARVTLAAGLAMAGGMALSPQRWFWAVITVYVVFLNARSRGDTIYKGVQRLGGTLLGIASGLVLATVLAGAEGWQGAALLLSVFGMYYFITASYTLGVFCVTVMLGLLYGMLGAPLEMLLVLRLEETAIGAAAAILVAAFVLPTRTRDQVMRSGRAVLTALVQAVRSSREALSGVPGAAPTVSMRLVDRQLADLRLALAPLTARRALRRRSALEQPVPALLDCINWARALAAASLREARRPEAAALAAQAGAIEAQLARLAGVRSDAPAVPAAPPVTAEGGAAAALGHLEQAVATLAQRLEIGALDGFALDA